MSDDELSLRILDVEPGDEIAGARHLRLRTTRGEIPIIVHAPEVRPVEVGAADARRGAADTPGRAVLCISGAIGGFDGPGKLYVRLGLELPRAGNHGGAAQLPDAQRVRRMRARHDGGADVSQGDAVRTRGASSAIPSAARSRSTRARSPRSVTTVIAVSSQLAGAHVVAELAPRPLLLLHGTADTILPHECSERIYERAQEPRTLKLFPGVGHRFTEAADELLETGPRLAASTRI